MPIPAAAVGAIAQAGGDLISQGLNAVFTNSQNKKSRQWQEKMYGIQRADSLADYHMQNAYNHPSAVMARYKEAKLNPNLIYGNGTSADAAPVRSSTVGSPSFDAPKFDIGGALGGAVTSYYDNKIKMAQTDNLQKQNTLLELDGLLKLTDLEHKQLNLGIDQETRQTIVDMKKTSLDALEANLQGQFISNDNASFQGQANKQTLLNQTAQVAESILSSKKSRELTAAQIRNTTADTLNKFTTNQKLHAEISAILVNTINAQKTGTGIDYENVVKQLDAKMAEYGLNNKTYAILQSLLKQL